MSMWGVIIGLIVALAFGLFKRQQKKRKSSTTKIIIVNNGDRVDIDTGTDTAVNEASVFKRILTLVVSAAAAFAAAGVIIVFFIEPEIGPIDPASPIAIALYITMTFVIYWVIRKFSRN